MRFFVTHVLMLQIFHVFLYEKDFDLHVVCFHFCVSLNLNFHVVAYESYFESSKILYSLTLSKLDFGFVALKFLFCVFCVMHKYACSVD